MNNVYRFTILFCLLTGFNSLQAIAQPGKVYGQLTDEKGGKLAFANIILLKAKDSSFSAGAVTDKEGRFNLSSTIPDQYFLQITTLGFLSLNTATFKLGPGTDSLNLGVLILKNDPKTLKEISVSALRPTITQQSDKMVVSVQGTALAAGSTAYDVLARSPGVFIDHEGNIQLNGRPGVTVMIDGRRTYLSANELRNLLQSMPAENLHNLEIITNPSAKYDAEGSSGILNINLKKNTQQGISGSVYSGVNYNGSQFGYSAGGNLNYKKGRWTSFLTSDLVRRAGGREASFTRIFYTSQKVIYFDQTATGNFEVEGPPSVRFGTDFAINPRHSIGVMGGYITNQATQEFLTQTEIGFSPHHPEQYIDAKNYSSSRYRNLTTNLHYSGKLDTTGTMLNSDLDFIQIRSHATADFINQYTNKNNGQVTSDLLYTDIPSGFDIYSAKLDFVYPFSTQIKIEAGLKASHVRSENDSRFYFNNNGLVPDPNRTNQFNFKEEILAAYINYHRPLGKKASLQAGLRVEQTINEGNLVTTGQVTNRKYTGLFPSLFLQQKPGENYGITWSYSRRIQRPGYGSLNPFRLYRDPYTYVEGNPFLRPQYAHAFSVTQTFRKNYTLVLSYQLNKDFMAELPRLIVDSATTIYYTGNVDGNYSYGATAIAPVRISKKWDLQNTVVLSYMSNRIMVDNQPILNNQLYYSVQSLSTIQLPKSFVLEINLLYQGPAAYGLYQIAPRHRTDIGVKKSFWNKKMDISLNAVDIFKGQRLRFETDINENSNDFDQYLRNRYIGLTLRYNFSKGQKVDVKKRSASPEELNRT
jgi:hypothetical protein